MIPPLGIPYEYNYWDYIDAWDRVLLYQNNFGQHSWSICLDLLILAKLPPWFSQWISDFGPQIHYMPLYINKKI